MGIEQINSQPLIPDSPVSNLSNLPSVNITEKKDIIPAESWNISPDLTQSLPLQSNEDNDSVELLGEDLPVQSPLDTVQLREVNPLESKRAEERGNISIYSNNIELSPSKIQQPDSELVSPFSPTPTPSTLPSINITVNRGKELIEETNWERISNSDKSESAQPASESISIPAEAVEEAKLVEFLGAESWERAPTPEAESQLVRPIVKIAQPQITSLVAQARSPSVTAREQPTIRVSIGRIEVQAIAENQPWENLPPEKPPTSSQPAVPRLSLEEYLKSRQGGRR